MKITSIKDVFDRYIGGSLIEADGRVHAIARLEERKVMHDTAVSVVTTDGGHFLVGYHDALGVEHEGKFYLDDNGPVLEVKK